MLGFAVVGAVLLVMGSGFSTYVIDLRSRTESADRIHQLSFNDTMTGLPNRIAFNERLAFDAAEAHEKAHKLAAFSIDVDGFKDVNDVFGHAAGDQLLIEVANRMRGMLGPGEFLARQSGDEFLGLKTSGNHPEDAQAFAERIAGGVRRAVPDRRPAGQADRLDRLFDLPDRHARARSRAEQRQARDASRQEQAARHDHAISPGDGRQGARPPRAVARPAMRRRAQRARAALPAADDARRRQDLRRRSADALAASEARHGFARRNSFRLRRRPKRSSAWANGRCAPPAATPPRAEFPARSPSTCRRCSSPATISPR